MLDYATGNIDSEGLGGVVGAGQAFATQPYVPPSGGGFDLKALGGLMNQRDASMRYYEQLGQTLQGLMAQMQGMQQPQGGGGFGVEGDLGVGGFNQNWLSDALAAGSANGAKVGK
jgi:hypothetical protein